MEHKSRVEMAVMNVQDFGDSRLQMMMTRPCVMKGFGSGLSAIQAAFQTFAIDLKKEAANRKGCPGRLLDDVSPGDAKVLEGIVDKMFIQKLFRQGQMRLAMWPSIPDALSLPTLTSSSSPILFGNIGCYEATMVEKKFCGSVRVAFSGRRIVCAAPWSVVIKAYLKANPRKEGEKSPVAKAIRDWFRNLTEDRFDNESFKITMCCIRVFFVCVV